MATATATATDSMAVALTHSEWGTVRTALICYAGDQREAGNDAWADQIMRSFGNIRNQTR